MCAAIKFMPAIKSVRQSYHPDGMLDNKLSLRKAVYYAGCSRLIYYYKHRERNVR
jgi:hypothetical protein